MYQTSIKILYSDLKDFLSKHGVLNKKNDGILTCPVMKLTNKSKNWIRDADNHFNPTYEYGIFQFINTDNEIIYGLRFYFPIEIHTDDKSIKQDKFLVLELMKGNNDNLFFAYYDFDNKKYYPTNIPFTEETITKRDVYDDKSLLTTYQCFCNSSSCFIECDKIEKSHPSFSRYDEERSIVFEDIKSTRCQFLLFIKKNWKQCIYAACVGIVVGIVLAQIFVWPWCFCGVGIFICWMLRLREPNVIELNYVPVNSVPLHLNRKPPEPQPPVNDQLKSTISTHDKDSRKEEVIPNSDDNKSSNKDNNEVINNNI